MAYVPVAREAKRKSEKCCYLDDARSERTLAEAPIKVQEYDVEKYAVRVPKDGRKPYDITGSISGSSDR